MRMTSMKTLGLLAGAMLAGIPAPLDFIHPSEPNRGWNGFLGNSKNSRKKHSNKLRYSHNAKLKRRKAA